MLKALTEVEARRQLRALPHDCGDATFAPPMTRSHDEHGLWLVFRGPCPRCTVARELRFHAHAPRERLAPQPVAPFGPPAPGAPAVPRLPRVESTREEDELYPTQETRCTTCDGAGQWSQPAGDYASMDTVRCFRCGGSGLMRG